MKQKEIFLENEGDAWFKRNLEKISKSERAPVESSIERLGIKPRKILEMGCSNGYRLNKLQIKFGAECWGIDPSFEAVLDSKRFSNIFVKRRTADRLLFEDDSFDLVIFGFCLYLVDPKDLFMVAKEADRVLQDNGFLIILDFLASKDYKNKYYHKEGLYGHKMEWQKMFTWNPAYKLLDRSYCPEIKEDFSEDNRIMVDVLYKNTDTAFPLLQR